MDGSARIPELTPVELITRIEAGEDVHVLDVRAPASLSTGRVDIVRDDRFHNMRGSEILALSDPTDIGLPKDRPVAVVCGRGNDSRFIAHHLNLRGFQSASLAGGMIAWMNAVIPRELERPPELDRFVQLDRMGKGALAYVLISDGEAMVVDPARQTEPIISLVEGAGARVVAVADTHAHADYISGGARLAAATGAPYYLHPGDAVSPYDGRAATIPFRSLEDGQTLRVGRATIGVVHTPGHTEGSVTYQIGDRAALTGDFIFVGSVGRPDLGGQTEAWTRVLWQSLERARTEWSPTLRIHPAHYATEAERETDRSVGRALGELVAANEPLSLPDEQAFTDWVMSRAGTFPEAYRLIKTTNLGLERPSEAEMVVLEAGRNECALG